MKCSATTATMAGTISAPRPVLLKTAAIMIIAVHCTAFTIPNCRPILFLIPRYSSGALPEVTRNRPTAAPSKHSGGSARTAYSQGSCRGSEAKPINSHADPKKARKSVPIAAPRAAARRKNSLSEIFADVPLSLRSRVHSPTPTALLHSHGFSQIARLIHIAAAAHGDVIGEKLERQNFQNRRENFRRRRNFNYVIGGLAREAVAFADNRNHDPVPRLYFLNVRNCFFIARQRGGIVFVARGDDHHRQIFINQRVRAVLHFAGGIAFGVNVGNFLQLQRAFQRDGVMNAAAEIQKIRMAEKL